MPNKERPQWLTNAGSCCYIRYYKFAPVLLKELPNECVDMLIKVADMYIYINIYIYIYLYIYLQILYLFILFLISFAIDKGFGSRSAYASFDRLWKRFAPGLQGIQYSDVSISDTFFFFFFFFFFLSWNIYNLLHQFECLRAIYFMLAYYCQRE